MSERDIFVFYSSGSYQPMGVFSSKEHAISFARENRVGGNVACYRIDVGLLENVISLGAKINSPELQFGTERARFSSAYPVRVQIDPFKNTVVDHDTGEVEPFLTDS